MKRIVWIKENTGGMLLYMKRPSCVLKDLLHENTNMNGCQNGIHFYRKSSPTGLFVFAIPMHQRVLLKRRVKSAGFLKAAFGNTLPHIAENEAITLCQMEGKAL